MLFAARSATALYRLLDVLPVFAGDERISRSYTLVPGSDFGIEALSAVERAGARTIAWGAASRRSYDLVLAASPKGDIGLLRGPRVLLPHGAGFGKSVPGEGSGTAVASGLDPVYLLSGDRALASFHALAHPSQVVRLAAASPQAAARAKVVGDPTLDRVLRSRSLRDRYRVGLGTGARTLVVLTSTWGPESLLRRRPTLAADLVASLPHDAYQVALVVHPNERSGVGAFDLSERLSPALDAGLVLAGAYEEWAAVLVAADAVITDHGSTALYAAALGRPLIGAYDGGEELIPGTPLAQFLERGPRLREPDPGGLEAALVAHRPDAVRALARSVFAEQGRALERLREEVYQLLDLAPPPAPVEARALPLPRPAVRRPAAFAVRIRWDGSRVVVERLPAHTGVPAHHLAAEYGSASERHLQSAGLVYRRAAEPAASPHSMVWTAGGWTARVLDDYPGCRTAAAVVSPSLCLVRRRTGALLTVRVAACRDGDRIVHADPAAVLSAVHAWLAAQSRPAVLPAYVTCVIGGQSFQAEVSPASAAEAEAAL
ncbi:translation initiation factor 2 [Streptomyces sp. WAC00263]|uniref:translation initiation factor 2 n=1 Tax=Streptomyces sp. WAC00263 TaxID=1917422 RepID=UPI0015EF8383|nr:translation initiation factor 2 [Streptomyces sp. WAC00263]KAF5990809.1 translation initiation factor 2 [Streptomyces sp. WAC00263]